MWAPLTTGSQLSTHPSPLLFPSSFPPPSSPLHPLTLGTCPLLRLGGWLHLPFRPGRRKWSSGGGRGGGGGGGGGGVLVLVMMRICGGWCRMHQAPKILIITSTSTAWCRIFGVWCIFYGVRCMICCVWFNYHVVMVSGAILWCLVLKMVVA